MKTCRFCNTENEDTENLCSKCGSELPIYQQYDTDMPKKAKVFSVKYLNLKLFIYFFCALILLFLFCFTFCQTYEQDSLPSYNSLPSVKYIENIIKSAKNDPGYFTVSINTSPRILSLYLTSLINPDAKDIRTYKPNMLPRIIVNANTQNENELSVTYIKKSMFMESRIIFLFARNEKNKWKLKSYKFNRWPHSNLFKDKIYASHKVKLLKLLQLQDLTDMDPNIDIKNNNIYIKLQKGTSTINTDSIRF